METNKNKYIAPAFEIIKLDNEISLALESTPPVGPGEGPAIIHNSQTNDPIEGSRLA